MKISHIFAAIIILLIFLVAPLIGVYADLLWFSSIDFSGVFLTIFTTKLVLGIAAALITFIVLYLAVRLSRKKRKMGRISLLLIVLSLLVGASFSNGWMTVLKYMNASSFGIADPIFANDVSFYVFTLPFYSYILGFAFVIIVLSIVATLLGSISFERKEKVVEGVEPEPQKKTSPLKNMAKSQLSFFVGLLFLVISAAFLLERFNILLSSRGAVFGAGYTDIFIHLPFVTIMAVVSIIIAIFFFAGIRMKTWKLRRWGIIIFIALIIVGFAAEGVVQQFIVAPDEFNQESGYIQRNINFTSIAYGLDAITQKPFPVSNELTAQDLENNRITLDNIRLWDFRPLKRTYNQLQLFRTYYEFRDIDIDRYNVGGNLRQIMLSPRELDQAGLDIQAQTWVNKHLVFTHGYGVAANAVDQVSEEGLPVFLIKDIPPQSSILDVDQPEIYFGELTNDFIVVDTTTDELDYPSGDTNVYTTYEGSKGIPLSGINKLVYAIDEGSIELLISGSLKPESKLIIHRNIAERIQEIAPFLRYDQDPYMVVADDKLYWIIDAYTTTDKYPYSEPFAESIFTQFNYIRNSVKVTIDAYTGETIFYVIDSEDPLVLTYRSIFPELFKDFSEMPKSLKDHIRYPEGLFRVQADLYSIYHMKDPRVFYNKEDVWNAPQELYRGTKQELIPYYIIMKLPEEDREEFILMLPFTPRNKDNMIGWMAARSDGEHYGELIVFTFSKQELIFGPLQIEARIDQDAEISQLITLWSQSGSDVIRGNLLVIPIEDSILYIEPVYLEASETGALPEFRRVIVVFNDRLVMEETLDKALTELFGSSPQGEPSQSGKPTYQTQAQLISKAQTLYDQARSLLQQGDFAGYADKIEELGLVLGQLDMI